MDIRKAVSFIDKHKFLLVFPINNKADPLSLWHCLYPKSEMRWEWDSGGDNRVANLWHLRERLSRSGKCAYGKWYQGRATLISLKIFPALLSALNRHAVPLGSLERALLEFITLNSPISSKQLKKQFLAENQVTPKQFENLMKTLWSRFLIVGYGEVDDGAFPSLAVGATEVLFEDEWKKSRERIPKDIVDTVHALGEKFWKQVGKVPTQLPQYVPAKRKPLALVWKERGPELVALDTKRKGE